MTWEAENGPEEAFVDQVRDALVHLYDYAALQSHALASRLKAAEGLSAQNRMRLLRTTLLRAIERLNPGPGLALRSIQARSYNVLNLHYVEGLIVREVGRELAISERQVYRDLREAEEKLAILLAPHFAVGGAPGEPPVDVSHTRADLLLQEAARLSAEWEDVPLESLLSGTAAAVSSLAANRRVEVRIELAAGLVSVHTNRQIARQVILNLLSQAVQEAKPGSTVSLGAQPHGEGISVRIGVPLAMPIQEAAPLPLVAQQLVRELSGQCTSALDSEQWILTCTLGKQVRATVLVVDDNAGLIELFRRYLKDEPYEIIPATDGSEGLRLAEQAAPDIVVLDVMMPNQDGWEVLQRLRNQPSTRHIPVIICSVLNDTELAFSLGAAAFIAKPVSRPQLVSTLESCL